MPPSSWNRTASTAPPMRPGMDRAGWQWRRFWAQRQKELEELRRQTAPRDTARDAGNSFKQRINGPTVNDDGGAEQANNSGDPFKTRPEQPAQVFDPGKE